MALSSLPSFTLKVKFAWASPVAPGTGVKVRSPSSMSTLEMTSSAITAVPSSANAPTTGRVAIFTLASVSAASASAKLKSSAVKVYAVSWTVSTVLSAAVGAALAPPATTVPLTAKRKRKDWLLQVGLRMSAFVTTLPMLHPIAAAPSNVLPDTTLT